MFSVFSGTRAELADFRKMLKEAAAFSHWLEDSRVVEALNHDIGREEIEFPTQIGTVTVHLEFRAGMVTVSFSFSEPDK